MHKAITGGEDLHAKLLPQLGTLGQCGSIRTDRKIDGSVQVLEVWRQSGLHRVEERRIRQGWQDPANEP